VLEQRAVGQAGQRILEGQGFNDFRPATAVGDILEQVHQLLRLAVLIDEHLAHGADPRLDSVVAIEAELEHPRLADLARGDHVCAKLPVVGMDDLQRILFEHAPFLQIGRGVGEVHLARAQVVFAHQQVIELQRHPQALFVALGAQHALGEPRDVAGRDHDRVDDAVVAPAGVELRAPEPLRAVLGHVLQMAGEVDPVARAGQQSRLVVPGHDAAGVGSHRHRRRDPLRHPGPTDRDKGEIQVQQGYGKRRLAHQRADRQHSRPVAPRRVRVRAVLDGQGLLHH